MIAQDSARHGQVMAQIIGQRIDHASTARVAGGFSHVRFG
jgi:hypothetical protein